MLPFFNWIQCRIKSIPLSFPSRTRRRWGKIRFTKILFLIPKENVYFHNYVEF